MGANFWVPKEIRSDGGSQFTPKTKLAMGLATLLRYKHLVVVAYHPQANGIFERRRKEVMNHQPSLVFENRICEVWNFYLPLVQLILNYSVDSSIRTQPASVTLGDVETLDIAFDVPV